MKAWTNGTETWIAESMEHLREIHQAQTGEPLDEEFDAWTEIPADKAIRIGDEETDTVKSMFARDWIAMNGPGLLCTTDR